MTRDEKIGKVFVIVDKYLGNDQNVYGVSVEIVDAIDPRPCCHENTISHCNVTCFGNPVAFEFTKVKFEVGDEVRVIRDCWSYSHVDYIKAGRVGKIQDHVLGCGNNTESVLWNEGKCANSICRSDLSLVRRAAEIKTFKVGDRVKYIGVCKRSIGCGTVIESIADQAWPHRVEWDNSPISKITSEIPDDLQKIPDRRKRQHVKPTPETYFVPVGTRVKLVNSVGSITGTIDQVLFAGGDKTRPPSYGIRRDYVLQCDFGSLFSRSEFEVIPDRRK